MCDIDPQYDVETNANLLTISDIALGKKPQISHFHEPFIYSFGIVLDEL